MKSPSRSTYLRRSPPVAADSCRVLGIDASLSSTGYAYRQGARLVTGTIATSPLKNAHRLFYVRMQLGKVLDVAHPTLAVIEDYAMGARGNNMFHIGELGGVLKTLLWERGISYLQVSPSSMKSVIALDGRAEKERIATALRVRFNMTVTQNDEADAAGLMLVGEMKAGLLRVEYPDRFAGVRDASIIKGRLTSISKTD